MPARIAKNITLLCGKCTGPMELDESDTRDPKRYICSGIAFSNQTQGRYNQKCDTKVLVDRTPPKEESHIKPVDLSKVSGGY